jgi:hypothetical protein
MQKAKNTFSHPGDPEQEPSISDQFVPTPTPVDPTKVDPENYEKVNVEEELNKQTLNDGITQVDYENSGYQPTDPEEEENSEEESEEKEEMEEQPKVEVKPWFPADLELAPGVEPTPLPRAKFATTRSIKHNYSTDQKEELAQELAGLVQRKRELEEARKSSASQYKAQIDSVDADLNIVTGKVQNGYEHHNHDVIIYYHPEKGLKYFVNKVTNKEVDRAKMDAKDYSDCQLSLF